MPHREAERSITLVDACTEGRAGGREARDGRAVIHRHGAGAEVSRRRSRNREDSENGEEADGVPIVAPAQLQAGNEPGCAQSSSAPSSPEKDRASMPVGGHRGD